MTVNNEEIFNGLVRDYSEQLYWHVRYIVGDHEDADDVMQDVFLKAWKALPGFRGESSAYTWLWRIATNEALNFLRKRKFRSLVLPFVEASSVSSDPYFDGNAAQAELRKAIDSLPPKQRSVFCMRYFEEIPYSEMAGMTGTSEGALKASYHIAEEKIKNKLNLK